MVHSAVPIISAPPSQAVGLSCSPTRPSALRSKAAPLVARASNLSVSFVACEFRTEYLTGGCADAVRAALDREGEETLEQALERGATLAPFATLTADWDTPLPCTDTLTLETAEQ